MGYKNFTAKQIIFKIREIEILAGQGESIAWLDDEHDDGTNLLSSLFF